MSFIDRPFAPPLTENQIQRAVFDQLKKRAAPNVFAFHPKNGGSHQEGKRRAINAMLGVVSGVPDVIAIKDGKVFGHELKADGGRVSKPQVETLQRMQDAGATVAVTYGLSAALEMLEGWGLLIGEAQ